MKRKKYNPQMPSTGYERADYEALRSSSITPALAETSGMRFDSAEQASVFFARELDYIKARSYDKIYPEFSALNHFPITHEVPEGAETTTYYSYEKTGMAAIISNYATDLPRADVKGEPTTAYIKSIGDSFGYSIQDMRASRLAGKSLDTRKGESAKYQIERKINTIAWAGDKKHKLMGILSADNDIPVYSLSTVDVDGVPHTDFKYKTPNQMLDDINGMFAFQSEITQDVERADTLAVPSSTYIDISTRQIPNTGYTVKKFLLENAPYLTDIISAPELSGSNAETNPYGQNAMVLFKNDPDKFSLEIPLEFYQYPLQPENLEIKVPCEARTAGIILYYPLSLILVFGV